MRSLRRGIAGLSLLGVFAGTAAAQTKAETGLRQEVEQLKREIQSIRNDLDRIKATLQEQNARANPVFDIGDNPSIGTAAAKLVLIEFSDFECPFCLEYTKTIYRQLVDVYVSTGKLRYVFVDFPGENSHPNSLRAAEAGRCAKEQGRFWEMHDELFAHQRTLATTGVTEAAVAAGLALPQFEPCLANGKYTASVRASERSAAKLGLRGTPAFVFGTPDPADPSKIKLVRALVGAQPYAAFQQAIDGVAPK